MSADGITRRELFRQGRAAGRRSWPSPGSCAGDGGRGGGRRPRGRRPRARACAWAPTSTSRSACARSSTRAGTYTILSGSTMLPEVRAAMAAASQHYVHLDELAEAIGARLADADRRGVGPRHLGCSAALTHATAACVAGGNPDLHVRIPNLAGFPKDEVDHPQALAQRLRRRPARGRRARDRGDDAGRAGGRPRPAHRARLHPGQPGRRREPAQHEGRSRRSRRPRGVPVLVDAAAEILTVPNVHLQNGATLVAYSGGKCLRGPQAAGLLLGRKDLVKAAWVHSAPHHGYARGYKVGKEEAIGMLMAVEMWMKRDHDAEWKRWTSWLEHVAKRVSAIDGVTTTDRAAARALQPDAVAARLLGPQAVRPRAARPSSRTLFDTDPRVGVFPARGESDPALTGVTVNPYMMAPGDEKIVADRLHAMLSSPPRKDEAEPPAAAAPPTSAARGTCGSSTRPGTSSHALSLRQRGNEIDGAHRGDFVSRDLTGTIDGDTRAPPQRLRRGDAATPRTTRSPARWPATRWPAPSTWANTWARAGRRRGARARRG